MVARTRKIQSRAKEDGARTKQEASHLCSNCAHSSPVTDKWLANETREPTLAHCEFRRYLVLWHGGCQEPKGRWKEKR